VVGNVCRAERKTKSIYEQIENCIAYTHAHMQSLPPQLVEVGCAVHMCSLLHRRYSEFSGLLLEQLQRIYSPPPLPSKKDDDRAANVTKFRLGLRLLGEVLLYTSRVQKIRHTIFFLEMSVAWIPLKL
jgi:hypothetical protein